MKQVIKTFLFILLLITGVNAQDTTRHQLSFLKMSLNSPVSTNLYGNFNSTENNSIRIDRKIDYKVLGGIGLVNAGIVYAINNYYANTWWKDQSSDFKVVNDWGYALWIDKIGHFYGTYLISHFFSASFDYANLPLDKAYTYAALAALSMQYYVELEDAYGPQWGFSPGDIAFDVLGAIYGVSQYYYPYLKNFQPRVSYYPSDEYLEGKKEDANISDDYEGQKLWLAFRMNNLLPKELDEYWPSFLMLSLGYSVHNLSGAGDGESRLYLAFDIDAEEIPLYGEFWQFIKNTLNYIHFPLPGIRITPSIKLFAISY